MRRFSWLLGLVPLLGLAELILHQFFATRAPDAPDYAELGSALSKLKRPGVPVVVAPAWAEPLVRQAAPEAFPLNELARTDAGSFAEFLEVSILGQSAPELAGLPMRERQQIGAFELRRRENPRAEPTRFDFTAAVAEGRAEIFTELGQDRQMCSFTEQGRSQTGGLHGHVAYPRRRYECARGRLVGVTVVDDREYRARRCVLVQLPDTGRVVLQFGDVPSSARLVGFVGSSYFLERDATTPELELVVAAGARPLFQRTASAAQGFQRFELARPADSAQVEVRLRRVAGKERDFCFSLEAR